MKLQSELPLQRIVTEPAAFWKGPQSDIQPCEPSAHHKTRYCSHQNNYRRNPKISDFENRNNTKVCTLLQADFSTLKLWQLSRLTPPPQKWCIYVANDPIRCLVSCVSSQLPGIISAGPGTSLPPGDWEWNYSVQLRKIGLQKCANFSVVTVLKI